MNQTGTPVMRGCAPKACALKVLTLRENFAKFVEVQMFRRRFG